MSARGRAALRTPRPTSTATSSAIPARAGCAARRPRSSAPGSRPTRCSPTPPPTCPSPRPVRHLNGRSGHRIQPRTRGHAGLHDPWGGKNHYYLTDALGSVVALTDEAGTKVNTYAYSPCGVQRAATTEQVPQPYRFAGGYQDPTGLYHFAARYYDPNIGRFTTPDPSGQEQNPYLYAAGDPVNRIDPTGLFSFADGVGVVAGTIAGAAAVATAGVACAGTASVGCVAAGAVTAALWGAGAGGAGATIAGGTQAERETGAIGGLLGGLSGPIGSALFG